MRDETRERTRRRHRRIEGRWIHESDRTRAPFGEFAPSPAGRVVEEKPRGYFF